MKTCPNCQASFSDDSLKFCLDCGTPLPEARERQTSGGGNGAIIAAILGGFVLLALVVGGLGLYLFSQRTNEPKQENTANRQTAQSDLQEEDTPQSNKIPSVEQLNSNRKTAPFPVNSNSSNSSSDSSAPRIVASSSSVRKEDKGNFYFPTLAFDNNPATAWCEGVKGAGVGQWLQFNFDREVTLKQIRIQPGYFKNSEAWSKNNRVAGISVQFSDGSTRKFSFPDEMKAQTIDINGKRTGWVKITLDDYFAGDSDSEDTLISEVSFVTEQ